MALEVGDRHIVGAKPSNAFAGDERWPCGRCGRSFPRSATWVVKYLHDDGDPFTFIVCPDCGEELDPVSVVIDLAALDELRDEADLSELESLVSLVEELRDDKSAHTQLALRWMDLDVIASAKQMTVPEFVMYLEQQGVIQGRRTARRKRPRT